MRKAVVREDRQHPADASAVVGAQGGAVGPEGIPVSDQRNGILPEIVPLAADLLADHIHVGLQHQGRLLLPALGAGFVNDYVVQSVPHIFKAQLLRKGGEVSADALLIAGTAGDRGNLFKITVDGDGNVGNGHIGPPIQFVSFYKSI